jgi:sodium-independent sulfate anion transporter 11
VYGVDRPFFHLDLHDAVDAAVRDARTADQKESRSDSATSAWSDVSAEPRVEA